MLVNDLPAAIRAGGLTVHEDSGWQGRKHGEFAGVLRGLVLHNTGSSSANAWTIVRDGRPDLDGPSPR